MSHAFCFVSADGAGEGRFRFPQIIAAILSGSTRSYNLIFLILENIGYILEKWKLKCRNPFSSACDTFNFEKQ